MKIVSISRLHVENDQNSIWFWKKSRATCIFPVILNEMNRKPPTSKSKHVHPFNLCAFHTHINVIIFIALEKKAKEKKRNIIRTHSPVSWNSQHITCWCNRKKKKNKIVHIHYGAMIIEMTHMPSSVCFFYCFIALICLVVVIFPIILFIFSVVLSTIATVLLFSLRTHCRRTKTFARVTFVFIVWDLLYRQQIT